MQIGRTVMCGRYEVSPFLEKSPLYEELWEMPLMEKVRSRTDFIARGEMKPGLATAALALNRRREKKLFPMAWGFTGGKSGMLINARTETASRRPTFSPSWESRRCLLPASAYYEWEHIPQADGRKKTGRKFRIAPSGEQLTWLCGLYRMEEDIPKFVILTRPPWEGISFIHDRMPLILPGDVADEWIDPSVRAEELLSHALDIMDFTAV